MILEEGKPELKTRFVKSFSDKAYDKVEYRNKSLTLYSTEGTYRYANVEPELANELLELVLNEKRRTSIKDFVKARLKQHHKTEI